MADRLSFNTRENLRTRIESTLVAIQSRALDLSTEALVTELQADAEELALGGTRLGLCAAFGESMADVIIADLTGRLGESDAEVAKRLGLERSSVSKILQRVRRNLGLSLRVPNNARTSKK